MLIKQPTVYMRLDCFSTSGVQVLSYGPGKDETHGEKRRPPDHYDQADAQGCADGNAARNGHLSCFHPGTVPTGGYHPHYFL